jgi:iron complex outermembrane receptor protein
LTPILSATWVGEYEAADTPRTPAYERVGVANTSGTIPRWRAAGTLAWEREAVQMSITGRYVGSYGDTAINVPNGRRVSPGALMDIQGSLDLASIMPASGLLSAMTARIGVNNVFDDGPDFAEVFGLGYDVSQGSLRQRFIYASLTTEF